MRLSMASALGDGGTIAPPSHPYRRERPVLPKDETSLASHLQRCRQRRSQDRRTHLRRGHVADEVAIEGSPVLSLSDKLLQGLPGLDQGPDMPSQIGRASCRERV